VAQFSLRGEKLRTRLSEGLQYALRSDVRRGQQLLPAGDAENWKQSLIWYPETTFGPNDPKTDRFKDMVKTVERVDDYRKAVEHPEGHSGTLKSRNSGWIGTGKFSVPA
jgi:hypothetical protein